MLARTPARTTLRRTVLIAAVVAGALLAVAPASADHGRYGRGPKVAVFVGLPPIAVQVGPRAAAYYGPPPYYYADGYAYEQGYDDGYRDRAYQERRRRHHRHHHHHHDCDD